MKHGADLETLLGYQIQRAHLMMTDHARRTLAPFGVTPAKLTALLLIRDNPGCDQTALGRTLNVNRSSAMKLVNVLVERGLAERRAGRNLRTNALHLLPEGELLVSKMVECVRQSDALTSARLTTAERKTLHALLRKLGLARTRKAKSADLAA